MDDLEFTASSDNEACKIESYSLVGSVKGASIDPKSGKVIIDTESISGLTTLQIAVKVGL